MRNTGIGFKIVKTDAFYLKTNSFFVAQLNYRYLKGLPNEIHVDKKKFDKNLHNQA